MKRHNVQLKLHREQLTIFRWKRIFLLCFRVLQFRFVEFGDLGDVWLVQHFRFELRKERKELEKMPLKSCKAVHC